MRTFLSTIAVIAALVAEVTAAKDADLPHNIRVAMVLIEVSHPVLTGMMNGPDTRGHVLYANAMALTKQGDAKLLESCLLATRPAQKGNLGGIREFIYPIIYDPPGGDLRPPPPPKTPRLRPWTPEAWEIKNTGLSLEIEPNISEGGGIVNLRLEPVFVSLARLDTWIEYVDHWGDGSVRQPVFETLRTNTSIDLLPGRFELIAVLTPQATAAGPVPLRKVLVFIRADIITVRPPG